MPRPGKFTPAQGARHKELVPCPQYIKQRKAAPFVWGGLAPVYFVSKAGSTRQIFVSGKTRLSPAQRQSGPVRGKVLCCVLRAYPAVSGVATAAGISAAATSPDSARRSRPVW